MAIGTNWAEIWAPVWGPVWQGSGALVTVPDVVGQSQASATAELEAVLFVVAVQTAYSSTVAAGLVISQSPTAGTDAVEGSTVTITVSLGPQSDQPTGGWITDFEAAAYRRRKLKEKERQKLEEAEQIPEKVTRDIAKLLKKQEAIDEEREELQRIQQLADKFVGSKMRETGVPVYVRAAVLKAYEERSFNALQQLSRVLDRMQEDEEITLAIAMLLAD